MKLYIQEKMFSLWGKYNVLHEDQSIAYIVQGQPSLVRRKMEIYDANARQVGMLQTKILRTFPQYTIWKDNVQIGMVQQRFSILHQKFIVDFRDWTVDGNFMGWDFDVFDASRNKVASIDKQIFNFTDHYVIDTVNDNDALDVLMLTLAISAIRKDAAASSSAAASSGN